MERQQDFFVERKVEAAQSAEMRFPAELLSDLDFNNVENEIMPDTKVKVLSQTQCTLRNRAWIVGKCSRYCLKAGSVYDPK